MEHKLTTLTIQTDNKTRNVNPTLVITTYQPKT
jgi:hypothetical protein